MIFFDKKLRAEYEEKLAQLRRELVKKDRALESLQASIAHLEHELARARKRLAELEHYERELEIEHIMRTMSYDELCEIEAKRATGEDVPDTYLEAAMRMRADNQRMAELLDRSRVHVQLRPPRRDKKARNGPRSEKSGQGKPGGPSRTKNRS